MAQPRNSLRGTHLQATYVLPLMTFTTWLGSAAAVFLLNSGSLGTFTPASVSSEKITYIVQVEIVFSPSFLWCHTAIHLLFVRSSRWIYQPSRLWCVRHGAVWNGRKAEVCRWRTDHPGPNGWLGHPPTKWKGLLRNSKGNLGKIFKCCFWLVLLAFCYVWLPEVGWLFDPPKGCF